MVKIKYGCSLLTEDILAKMEPLLVEAHRWLEGLRKAKEVGFMDLPYRDPSNTLDLARRMRETTDTLVLIGIGGSSLGAECVMQVTGKDKGFYVLDNVDPEKFFSVLSSIDPRKSCFNVVSKSGSTTETVVNFFMVKSLLEKHMSWDTLKKHLVITTDPEKGFLREFTLKENITFLEVPPNVGGRFSVLSDVGLFPAAYMGVDVNALLEGARLALDHCSKPSLSENPAWILAAFHYFHYRGGKNIAVMMPYCERLSLFVDWWRQLWAESLGKNSCGQTPVKAIGTVDQHSQIQLYNDGPKDKVITFMVVKKMFHDFTLDDSLPEAFVYLREKTLSEVLKASYLGTASALYKNGVPFITIEIEELNEKSLGMLFMIYEVATALSGYLYNLNPFDQPGVEEGKRLTKGLLGFAGFGEKAKEALDVDALHSKCLVCI